MGHYEHDCCKGLIDGAHEPNCPDHPSVPPEPNDPTPEHYRFYWRGVTFRFKHGNYPGFTSTAVAGDVWHAEVSVEGWRWTARLNVNGGIATGVGTTPWQALDAAVVAWQDLIGKLALALGEKPGDLPVG